MLITSRPWQAGMLLATVLLSTSVTAQQEPTGTPVSPQNAYISDKLITYLYNGPGRDFKIIGSIAAGEEIKLLAEDSTSDYWQLTDSKGRTGWILKQYVSLTPVFGGEAGELQQQLQPFADSRDSAELITRLQQHRPDRWLVVNADSNSVLTPGLLPRDFDQNWLTELSQLSRPRWLKHNNTSLAGPFLLQLGEENLALYQKRQRPPQPWWR